MKTIRRLRDERGWSQFELAVKVGVTPGAVGNWERGTSEPKTRQLRALGLAFGIPMEEIAIDESDLKQLVKIAA